MGKSHPYQLYVSLDLIDMKKFRNPKEFITVKILDKSIYDKMLEIHQARQEINTMEVMDPKLPDGQILVHFYEQHNNKENFIIILFEFDVVTDVRDVLEYLVLNDAFMHQTGVMLDHVIGKHMNHIVQQVDYIINVKPKLSTDDANALDNL